MTLCKKILINQWFFVINFKFPSPTGLNVFLDVDEIKGGEDWQDALNEGWWIQF